MTGEDTARDVHHVTEQIVKARFVQMLNPVLEQVLLIRPALIDGCHRELGEVNYVLEGELDQLERELGDTCLRLMSRGRATPQELRVSLMTFRSLADLERVGDSGRHVGRDLEAIGP